MNWNEIKIGYGLERIPRAFLGQGICCQMCHEATYLYTQEPTTPKKGENVLKGWDKMVARIRAAAFCKTHAIYMFGDKP